MMLQFFAFKIALGERSWTPRRRFFSAGGMLATALALFMAGCAAGGTGAGTTPTPLASATPTQAGTPAGGVPLKVYFAQFKSDGSDTVAPLQRYAPSQTGIEAFSIQLLIAGPTQEERDQGYFSELNSLFLGPSSAACAAPNPAGGPDFTLKLNMKGATPEQGTATVQFCRPTGSPGIGADERVTMEITATLKQFSGIQKVVILLQNGSCFGDESGMNRCLP